MKWTHCPVPVSHGRFPVVETLLMVFVCLAAPKTDEERSRDMGRSDFSNRRAYVNIYVFYLSHCLRFS